MSLDTIFLPLRRLRDEHVGSMLASLESAVAAGPDREQEFSKFKHQLRQAMEEVEGRLRDAIGQAFQPAETLADDIQTRIAKLEKQHELDTKTIQMLEDKLDEVRAKHHQQTQASSSRSLCLSEATIGPCKSSDRVVGVADTDQVAVMQEFLRKQGERMDSSQEPSHSRDDDVRLANKTLVDHLTTLGNSIKASEGKATADAAAQLQSHMDRYRHLGNCSQGFEEQLKAMSSTLNRMEKSTDAILLNERMRQTSEEDEKMKREEREIEREERIARLKYALECQMRGQTGCDPHSALDSDSDGDTRSQRGGSHSRGPSPKRQCTERVTPKATPELAPTRSPHKSPAKTEVPVL